MNRPYKYQQLKGDEKIRLLNIDPGTAEERVRATLIPAAFHEDRGCVASLNLDDSHEAHGKATSSQTPPARWTVLIYYAILSWIVRVLCWIRRVPPPLPAPQKPPTARETIKYDAVSWAWGDPAPNTEIEIMGENRERWTFEVSHKLEVALKAVRSPNTLRTVWIDAICIDQTNVHEKSHQVPMMDRIYGLADMVCVWLGPVSETHDAKTAFWLLKEILKDMDYKKTIEKCNVRELAALSGLMRRDWFSRRWIIQEIALAKDAVPVTHLSQNPSFSNKLLQALKAFDMTKVRARSFIVDYNQPYAEVCKQFIQFAIKGQSSRETVLDILCRPWAYEEEDHAKRIAMGMPKWVTTIALAPLEMTSHDSTLGLYRRNGDPFVGPPGKPPYNAAGGSFVNDRILKFASFTTLPEDQNPHRPAVVHSIIVTGFMLDRIDVIKDKVTSGALGALVPEEWLTLGGWLDITQPPPDALWRTLVGDRGPNGSSCPLLYPLCCAEALRLSQSVRNLETSAITSHPEKYESFVAGFCSRVQEVVVNRRMIRTKALGKLGLVSGREMTIGPPPDGRTGLSSTDAKFIRKGDMICILHGCSVPVVLRRMRKS
jgi:hypothetical protein